LRVVSVFIHLAAGQVAAEMRAGGAYAHSTLAMVAMAETS